MWGGIVNNNLMTKRARDPLQKGNTLNNYFGSKSVDEPRKQQININSMTRTGISNGKRKIIKQSKPSKEEAAKKYKVNLLLKEDTLDALLKKSPSLQMFLSEIQKICKWSSKQFIFKFLKSEKLRPWAQKYAPKELNELISNASTQKILKWIKAFNSFRNIGDVEMQDSFINDNSISLRQQQMKTLMFQQKWKLKALILLGREGIGKYTSIKCLTNSYNMRLFQCTNERNKINYCKQHYESIKSHCFKKQQKNSANTIKNYFAKTEGISDEFSRKIHLIHQINQIYPEDKRNQFYTAVDKFIKESQVPVILTCSDFKIPRLPQFQEYDIIEMQEFNLEQCARFIWTVLHIEYGLGDVYKNQFVKQEDLDNSFLKYFEKLKFQEVLTIDQIKIIIKKIGLRIDKILTFFQQYFLQNFPTRYISFEEIVDTIDNQNRYELSKSSNPSFLSLSNLSRFMSYESFSHMAVDPIQSLSQSVIDDLMTAAERDCQTFKVNFQFPQDCQLRNLVPIQKHKQILKGVCSKISRKQGCWIEYDQIPYIRLLQQKGQRRLRSKKAQKSQTMREILEKYITSEQVAYTLSIFE